MARRQPNDLAQISAEQATNRVLGSGPSFPFVFGGSGDIRNVEITKGLAKVNQAIHTLLTTRRGERVNRPTYGCFAGDTKVMLRSGMRVSISSLVGAPRVLTFGASLLSGTQTTPPGVGVQPIIAPRVESRGIKPVQTVEFADGSSVRCTKDHLFLGSRFRYGTAEELIGEPLIHLDTTAPGFARRLTSYMTSPEPTGSLLILPLADPRMKILSVTPGGDEEVFDVIDSPTSNWCLGNGVFVHNSDVPRLVFEPNDAITQQRLIAETAGALRVWEKRIRVTNVSILPATTLSPSVLGEIPGLSQESQAELRDPNMMAIMIRYVVLRTNQQGSYVFPFYPQGAPLTANLDFLPPSNLEF